jgi:WD40 repeat protein
MLQRCRFSRSVVLCLICLTGPLFSAGAEDTPILRIDPGGHNAPVSAVVFSPDGRQLFTAGWDKVVRAWDPGGDARSSIHFRIGLGEVGQVRAAAIDGDAKTARLAISVTQPPISGTKLGHSDILIVDAASHKLISSLTEPKGYVEGLSFSRDGATLAGCDTSGRVYIWSASGGTFASRRPFETEANVYLRGVALSPDGHLVAACGWRVSPSGLEIDGLARIWEIETGKVKKDLKCKSPMRCIAWSPAGPVVLGAETGDVQIWNPSDPKPQTLATLKDSVDALAFSPDGSRLITAGGIGGKDTTARVWSMPDGRRIAEFNKHQATVYSVGFSADGKLAASGDFCGAAYIWNPETGDLVRSLCGTGGDSWALGWSPDGSRIAWGNTRGLDSLDKGFDLAHSAPIESVDRRDNWTQYQNKRGDLHVAQQQDGTLSVSNGAGKEVSRIAPESGDHILAYSFVDEKQVLMGSEQYLALIDISGKPKIVRLFEGHEGPVLQVAVSPNGKYIASSSTDQTIRIWPLDAGAGTMAQGNRVVPPLLTLFTGNDGQWIAWSPEGYYAASPAGDDLIGWQVNRSADEGADYDVVATQFRDRYYRPDVLRHLLETGSTEEAAKVADRESGKSSSRGADAARDVTLLPHLEVTEVEGAAPGPDGYPTDRTTATVHIRVSNGDPNKLNWSVANRTHTRKLTVDVAQPKPDEKVLELPLVPGRNDFFISASNDVGESTPARLRILCKPATGAERKPDLWLIAVGVRTFADSNIPQLGYTADDAKAVAAFFAGQKGHYYNNVTAVTLVDKEATSASLLQELDGLAGKVQPGDSVIVFVASHGATADAGTRGGPGDICVVLSDTLASKLNDTAVKGDAIVRKLNALPISVNTLLVLDICHADQIGYAVLNDFLHDTRSRLCALTSCRPEESSLEDEEWKHGLFTYALLEALNGKAAEPDDHLVTLLGAANYVVNRVKERIHDKHYPNPQTPQILLLPTVNAAIPLAGP